MVLRLRRRCFLDRASFNPRTEICGVGGLTLGWKRVGRQSEPDVGPALPLTLRQVRHCCWYSADAGGKIFCFQSCRAHAVCTSENFHVQLPGVADGFADRRVCSEQAPWTTRDKFLTLPDYVQVHPAHGAGSACGKALGAIPSSTVGYERLYAWWGPYLAANDEQGFIDELLHGQPDAHAYFGRMRRENREGPAVMGERTPLPELATGIVAAGLAEDTLTFIDTRPSSEVHEGTVAGSLNVPAGKSVASYGAWVVNPETDRNPLVLLAQDQEAAQDMWDHLVRVGIDNVAGYVTSIEGLATTAPKLIRPEELDSFDPAMVLDVRNKTEHTGNCARTATNLCPGRRSDRGFAVADLGQD
jgi:hydroxyacylglutathione hydrolase